MPFINCMLNTPADTAQCDLLKARMADAMDTIAGKSESSLMIAVQPDVALYFQGRCDMPAAYISIRYIGAFSKDVKEELSHRMTLLLEEATRVSRDRVYISYTSVEREDWAWKGQLLG